MTNSPISSNRWVVLTPPQVNSSQAAKNRENTAHPMSTINSRRLLVINRSLKNQPAAPAIPKPRPGSLIELRHRRFSRTRRPHPCPPPEAGEGKTLGRGGSGRKVSLAGGFPDSQRDLLDLA